MRVGERALREVTSLPQRRFLHEERLTIARLGIGDVRVSSDMLDIVDLSEGLDSRMVLTKEGKVRSHQNGTKTIATPLLFANSFFS